MKTDAFSKLHPLAFLLTSLLLLAPAALKAGIVFDVPQVIAPCEAGQVEVKAELPFRVKAAIPELRITSIKTGCDCTVGTADAESYAPDAKGKIRLVFTVGERIGFQRKTITVKTSDGKETVAFFQTTVPAILTLKPAFVLWKKNAPKTAKQVQAKIVLEDRSVKITGLQITPAESFDATLHPPSKPGGRDYRISIIPRSTDKPITARIVLKTNFPNDETERFVIVGAVK
ncbi:MAG: DUF1573 domain-containing protein [Puniceicoccales bacterium]|jgi:hypothetical protein|nr:DUF1573 domain-containing protein [Puniceicoccales bacterium]